jgi:lysozyme
MTAVKMLPPSRPQITRVDALKLVAGFDLTKYPVFLVGIRGYYKDTMGKPGVNDRAMYDDAVCLVTPEGFTTFNFNTDPSRFKKGIAVLKAPGMYLYRVGMHGISGPNPYEALRQYGDVTVIRDGGVEVTDNERNRFWIDIHRGGYGTTSSLGCQTVPPDQWIEFFKSVKTAMKQHGQDTIPYCLVEV